MFGKLAGIFDKDFLLGYFLPALLFMLAALELADYFKLAPTAFSTTQNLGENLVFLVLCWLLGLFLLVSNRAVLRTMEGYGEANPMRIFEFWQHRRFRKLSEEAKRLTDERDTCAANGEVFPEDKRKRRNTVKRILAESFPPQRLLLPTSFGNTLRAFESYSGELYGLDAIPGWTRLTAVVSEDYMKQINAAKSYVDFWANIWVLAILLIIEYAVLVVMTNHLTLLWLPLVALGICLLAFNGATKAALEWGDLIKGAFDVFLPELRKRLELRPAASLEDERKLWQHFSQAAIYHHAESAEAYRQPTAEQTPNDA